MSWDGLSAVTALAHLRESLTRTLAWARDALAAPTHRGPAFWLVTVLLGLLLPAPVAVAVVAARLRRPVVEGNVLVLRRNGGALNGRAAAHVTKEPEGVSSWMRREQSS